MHCNKITDPSAIKVSCDFITLKVNPQTAAIAITYVALLAYFIVGIILEVSITSRVLQERDMLLLYYTHTHVDSLLNKIA